MPPKDVYNKNVSALRLIMWFWLVGWFLKIGFLAPYLLSDIVHYPIVNTFFPEILQSSLIAQVAYFFPAFIILGMVFRRMFSYELATKIMTVCSLILMLHSETYNDATFINSFWVGLYCMWFVSQFKRCDQSFRKHACSLAQCLVSMIFLGGFVGKITQGYWSGEVFYNIFFTSSPYFPFTYFRDHFLINQQRFIAVIFSRGIIFLEAFIALGFFIPIRLFCSVVPLFLFCFMFTNTWRILSVLLCLIGLLWASLLLMKEEDIYEKINA
jgi:hypothetical protein